MAENVELHPAFVWDCPSCGCENFCRTIVREFDEETEAELRDELGVQPYDQGYFFMKPKTVTCNGCKKLFDADQEDDGGIEEF